MEKTVFLRSEPQGIMVGLVNSQGSENFITLTTDQLIDLSNLISFHFFESKPTDSLVQEIENV